MIGMKAKPKKWGNSLAVIIPDQVVKKAGIRAGKPLELIITEKATVQPLWGTLKTKKTALRLKKEAAEGWN